MDDKKLFLLDAYALIYRAYYALIRAPRVTSKGFNTSAIFGFCNTIDEILRKENPSHIAVCFDPKGGNTFRHKIYPEYKATRDAQPEDITLSVPYIKDIVKAYNIPVVEMAGYEADDIIGTLSRRAEEEGFTTYMMTPDKDYGQLVTDRVLMYRPPLKGKDGEIRGVKEVCERYGIETPRQVIDLLALEGDVSDNIPGCPGVGEKTAVKLIREFHSVENLLDNTSQLKGALKVKITDNVEKIRLSKELATICTSVPIDIDIETLRRKPENVDRLRKIYTELEFKMFLSRLDRHESAEADAPAPTAVPTMGSLFDTADSLPTESPAPAAAITDVAVATSVAEAASIISRAAERNTVGIALHSEGEEAMRAKFVGLAVSLDPSHIYYMKAPSGESSLRDWASVVEPLFNSERTLIVSHDVKRDMILLRRLNIEFTARYYDTSVAHYVLQPEMRHRLRDLAFSLLSMNFPEESSSKMPKPYPVISPEVAPRLFGMQADAVLRLRSIFDRELVKNNLDRLLHEIEFPFISVLADMEWTGVRIDTAELAKLSIKLTAEINDIQQRLYELAGHTFNIGSPRQIGEILFEELKIDPKMKRTKSGAYSTTEEILEKYRTDYEIVDLILQWRRLNKLLATYINALPVMINPATGKLHTTYNQTVTATGRISSTNPNLQNIPVRTDLGRDIRRAFIPDNGCLLMAADYSQIELRLMADLSGDPDMVEAFHEGKDIHLATAAKIYKEPIESVTADQRRNAKTANFGIIYGISTFGLAERLGIPRAEAKMLIDGYFESYPHIREYINKAVEKAREKGYVTTVMGRRRYLPDINSRNAVVRSYAERNAVNAPLQGSAADIIKLAMINIHSDIIREGLRSRMILQVHDELVFNVVPDELHKLQEIVTRRMENAYRGKVMLEVSVGVASNWLEAH